MVGKKVLSIGVALGMIAIAYSGLSFGWESNTIFGLCQSAPQSDGASVTAWIPTRPDEIVTDQVGPMGQSGASEMYLYDVGNFRSPWIDGDTVRTMVARNIGDVGWTASCDLTLVSGSGIQQNPDMTLTQMVKPTAIYTGNMELSWVHPGDPNVIGFLVYWSTDGASWTIIGGSTINVAGYWWSSPCTIELADSWIPGTSFTHTFPSLMWDYYCLRYVYAANGVYGMPTQEHGLPGWSNPDGFFQPVYGPVESIPMGHYDSWAMGPVGSSSSTGPFEIMFHANCGCMGEYDDIYYSNDNNMTWNYIGSVTNVWGQVVNYPWTAPGSGTYWWIVNGDDWMGPGYNWPSSGTPAEAGPYVISLSDSPTDIALHKSGNDILIDWTTGIGPFEIWRSNYFNGTGFALYDTTAAISYLDVGALADGNDYAYIVRSQGSADNSNMGFKLIRALAEYSLAYNWIGLPYKTDLATADDVMDDINIYGSGGDSCDTLTYWDLVTQGFVSRTDIGAIRVGLNFVMQPGWGYQVHMTETVDWKIVGAAQNVGDTVTVNLTTNGLAFTWIAFPYNTGFGYADDVMDQINIDTSGAAQNDDINVFTYWPEFLQGYTSRTDLGAIRVGPNFLIVPGQCYQTHMVNENPSWEISQNTLYT